MSPIVQGSRAARRDGREVQELRLVFRPTGQFLLADFEADGRLQAPAKYWRQIKVPVLLVYGAHGERVPPRKCKCDPERTQIWGQHECEGQDVLKCRSHPHDRRSTAQRRAGRSMSPIMPMC